jgi:hypothetical protein
MPSKTAAKKTSGNPAKRAEDAQISSIQEFKKRRKGTPLALPSGLVVKARRVQLRTYLATGNVPNPLLEIVQEALQKGQEADISAIVGAGPDGDGVDMEQVNAMFELVEALVMEMVVEPKVHPLPELIDEDEEVVEEDDPRYSDMLEEAKDEDLVYIDDFDEEDKMFLFQWATGGTSDIATFREEAGAGMDAMAAKQGLQQPRQPTDRASKR